MTKKSSVVPGPTGKNGSYFLYRPVFTDDGGAAAVVTTKNTTVEPTTSTVAGTSSNSYTDEEQGCRANQTKEQHHREGRYTHSSISEDP
jgi:hypothetical protein